jgi:aspartate kinase
MIVMKFGGTSVQDAVAINRVADIVASKARQKPVVVASAMARVTDNLLGIARAAADRKFSAASDLVRELRSRHLAVASELLAEVPAANAYSLKNVEADVSQLFDELERMAQSVATLGELTPRSRDAIASFGERLSTLIITAAFRARGIQAELVDSRKFLITDDNFGAAAPDMQETERRAKSILLPIIESGRVPVAQGFIGSTPKGVTTTIGRGGGDYSASIIGAAVGADSIEIWTDVDGLMTADPRLVPEARRIRVISFAEAAELSYFGAKVLHPSTVLPAIERKIPVHIFNTQNPASEGTLISAEAHPSRNCVKSIAFKRGTTIINVTSTRMLQAYGFLSAIFGVFDRHQTSVDVVTTSEVSISMTLDNTERLEAINRDLSAIGEVTIERDKAIVCVVGDNLKFTPGIAAGVFRALGDSKVNVNMISQGASEINLTFVIDEKEIQKAVSQLHGVFFGDPDPEVFA